MKFDSASTTNSNFWGLRSPFLFEGTLMKLIQGFGINDYDGTVSYIIDGKDKKKEFYSVWNSMIKRCYSKSVGIRRPSYNGCVVCDQWKSLTEFKSWFDVNFVKGWHLDKDIIGQSGIYSPETCVFVPPKINSFITDRARDRGLYPLGVSFFKANGMFRAQCNNPSTNKPTHLGYFHTPEEAHEAWKKKKHEFALTLCEEYPTMDERIKERLSTMYL